MHEFHESRVFPGLCAEVVLDEQAFNKMCAKPASEHASATYCSCGRMVAMIDSGPVHADGRDDHEVHPVGPTVTVTEIMAYENGELDEIAMVSLFQRLVDNGMAWTLQGFYGRTAARLIEAGLVVRRRT